MENTFFLLNTSIQQSLVSQTLRLNFHDHVDLEFCDWVVEDLGKKRGDQRHSSCCFVSYRKHSNKKKNSQDTYVTIRCKVNYFTVTSWQKILRQQLFVSMLAWATRSLGSQRWMAEITDRVVFFSATLCEVRAACLWTTTFKISMAASGQNTICRQPACEHNWILSFGGS